VIGHTWPIFPLEVALRTDPDQQVREAAAYALGLIGNKRAVRPLLEAASSVHEEVRVWSTAIEQLGNLGERSAIPFLIKGLEDPSPEIRFWSIYALSELGDPKVIPDLERVASFDHSSVPYSARSPTKPKRPLIVSKVRCEHFHALGAVPTRRRVSPRTPLRIVGHNPSCISLGPSYGESMTCPIEPLSPLSKKCPRSSSGVMQLHLARFPDRLHRYPR
jgi:HEAT repeats/PBS lyase HEAT-like repeat